MLPNSFWPTVRIVLVIGKNFWKSRLNAENLQKFWDLTVGQNEFGNKIPFFFKRQKNQLCYKNPRSHLKKFLFLNRPYLYKRLRVANPILIPSLWHRWQLNRNIFKCFCNKKDRGRIKMRIMLWKKRENNVEKKIRSSFSFP